MTRGLSWELQLAEVHKRYRRDRRAVMFKTEPRRGRGGVFLEKAPPDFMGMVGGTAAMFDAKDWTSSSARWPLSSIKPHQARDLEACHINGGIAFIALRFHGVGRLLMWSEVGPLYKAWRMKHGPASLSADKIADFPEIIEGDWLACL